MYLRKYMILMLETHKMTQKEVASALNVDASLVSKWCSGERKRTSSENLKSIIKLFATSAAEKKKHLYFIFYSGSF
tara:strand:- start:68 stop:295 length:228 start_codon:yes stop_codon:yes gene_type:complete